MCGQTRTEIDSICVSDSGVVFYREVNYLYDQDTELDKTYLRKSLTPGSDVTNEPAEIQAICKKSWTKKVVSSYNDIYLTPIDAR